MKGNHALIEAIKYRIELSPDRAISFYDYMELCLYHPEHGYYTSERSKIGREGDFYTSSAIGGLMGEVMARYIMSQTNEMSPQSPVTLVEWGGGTGRLARQLLDELKLTAPELYSRIRYICVEKSLSQRSLQAEECKEHEQLVSWISDTEWVEMGPWEQTIVISNELPDAFAVHRIEYRDGQLFEIYVEWNTDAETFSERCMLLKEPEVLAYVEQLQTSLQQGQRFEVNMDAIHWIEMIAKSLRSGLIITVDYGDEEKELYASHRMKGTLMCYRSHTAHDDPYAFPGEQDMTAHINFSALMEAGERAGAQVLGYMTQKQFLVENGILSMLQDHTATDPFSPVARRNRAIRQLLLSDQMSELFKVLIQKK